MRPVLLAWLLGAGAAVAASCGEADDAVPALCAESSGTEIFERRVAPLLADDTPKSCNECHLAGVDLSLFVRSTPCETMACLQDLGLVDLTRPTQSTVLTWIGRASPSSPLITQAVIDAEYDGLLEWIEHSASCGRSECAGVTCGAPRDDAFCEYEEEPLASEAAAFDEGCDDLQLERLFKNSVYASRGRCFPCHFNAEEWAAPAATRFIDQRSTCEASSLQTMRNVVREGLIDINDPAQSLLLLKPLSEEQGGVPHGGHDKFYDGDDPAYENFRYWIERYAACQKSGEE